MVEGAMTLERKFHRPEAGLMLAEGVRIEGYASLFGVPDQGGDVVRAGAYARSLERLRAEGRAVKMLWQHDAAEPIGVWETVIEDARGLRVAGRLLPEVARGREAAALIGAGAVDGLSIGFRTVKSERDAAGRRVLHEIDLWEVSLVTFPMLSEARIEGKAEERPDLLRMLTDAFAEARRELAGR
jgi:HK97 family phage prohead protease